MAKKQNKIKLDGVEYVVLPLNWDALEACQEEIVLVQAGKGSFFEADARAAMLKIITASLQRGNPQVTEDVVRKGLDISNISGILEMVFSVSGFTDDGTGGGDQEGEGKAKGDSSQT